MMQLEKLSNILDKIIKNKSKLVVLGEQEVDGITMLSLRLGKMRFGLSKNQIVLAGKVYKFQDLVMISGDFQPITRQIDFVFMQTKTKYRELVEAQIIQEFLTTKR